MDEYIPDEMRRVRDVERRPLPTGAGVVAIIVFSAGLTLGAIVASFAWRML